MGVLNVIPESALLPTIIKGQQHIAPKTKKYLDEVESGHGRADIVFFNLDSDKAEKRASHLTRRIKSNTFLETLSALNSFTGEKIEITYLYKKLPYSEKYIKDKVFDLILKNNLGTISEDGYLNLNFKYNFAIEDTVAIEAKINNWKRGLYQAYRYKQYAQFSYLALYKKFIDAPYRNIQTFKDLNVGLISVDPTSETIEILHKPKAEENQSIFFQMYTNESILFKMGYLSA